MELISYIPELIGNLFIFIFGAICILILRRKFFCSKSRSLILYLWHTFFCLLYCWYVQSYGGDAIEYYSQARTGGTSFAAGTNAVIFITSFIINFFSASFIGTSLFYNILGSIGLIAFDASLKIASQNKSRRIKILTNVLIFLPSISFWSSSIGKDSFAFMSACLLLWSILNIKQRIKLLIFAISTMFLVRPHIAGLIMISLMISVLFSKNVSNKFKIVLSLFIIGSSILLIPFIIQYVGIIGTPSPSDLSEFMENRATSNMGGGSSIDISSMSLPQQLFSYMFRPSIFDVHSVISIAAAFDNFIMIYLFVIGIVGVVKHFFKDWHKNISYLFSLTYSILCWLILATTTANMGIAVRQKWMIAPFLIFLLVSTLDYKRPQRLSANGQNVLARKPRRSIFLNFPRPPFQ
ncbi:MAG: hypothetical protein B7X60_01700 [Polynucleobacter sp. 39-45-136]|jgi:hypothetical protein|nr:MAG: hypothetical protein B7X60_01700 [Polynucleobacter sp. 39-45-136]